MIKEIGALCDLAGRIIILFVPFAMEYAIASNSHDLLTNDGLRLIVASYSYILLIILSLIFLIIGSIVGYFYPTPRYGLRPYPKPIKVLISVAGGVLAFIYYIETKKDISPTIIIWVACVSFVFPAIIHLIHAFAIKFTSNKLNLSDEDLKRISRSLGNKDDQEN